MLNVILNVLVEIAVRTAWMVRAMTLAVVGAFKAFEDILVKEMINRRGFTLRITLPTWASAAAFLRSDVSWGGDRVAFTEVLAIDFCWDNGGRQELANPSPLIPVGVTPRPSVIYTQGAAKVEILSQVRFCSVESAITLMDGGWVSLRRADNTSFTQTAAMPVRVMLKDIWTHRGRQMSVQYVATLLDGSSHWGHSRREEPGYTPEAKHLSANCVVCGDDSCVCHLN